MITHKLTLQTLTYYLKEKLCATGGIMCKLNHYFPQSALKNTYFGILHLQYKVMTWENSVAKSIKKNSNYTELLY